jgi:hypothetical protein
MIADGSFCTDLEIHRQKCGGVYYEASKRLNFIPALTIMWCPASSLTVSIG